MPEHSSVSHVRDGSPQAKPAQGQERALVSSASCAVSLSLRSREASLGCIAKTSVVSLLGAGNARLGGRCPTPSKMGKEGCLGEGAGQAGKLKHMFPTYMHISCIQSLEPFIWSLYHTISGHLADASW